MNFNVKGIKSFLGTNEVIVFFVIVGWCMVVGTVNPAFWSAATVVDTARSMLVTLIFALCEMIVIISGGIDVSFPAIANFALYFTITQMVNNSIDSILIGYLMAIGIGVLFGLLNAILIGTFKIPTLIATLGVSSLANGGLLAFVGTREIGNIPKTLDSLSRTYLFQYTNSEGIVSSMSIMVLIPIVLSIIVWFLMKYTMLGRTIKAIGGDVVSAHRAGFNVTGTQYFIYIFTGAIIGIGAMTYTILMRNANPTNLMGSEMMVIAAVVMGGARITGGHGTVIGTVLGVMLVTLLSNNLILLGVPNYWQSFVMGVVIIIGVSITSIREKRIMSGPKL